MVETLSEACDDVVVRIQLHGRFTIEADGKALEQRLPGRRARLLVAYLAAHPHTTFERSALIELLWQPDAPGPGAEASFATLLSKTRTVLAPAEIRGRRDLRLVLPAATLVDAERATAALHDAQGAAAIGDWRRAWAQGLSAVFVTQREFLAEFNDDWVIQRRAECRQLYQDATACYGEACLHLGEAELPGAERCGRRLIEADPLSERGYRLLMRALAQRGDRAAALILYEQLRGTLRNELGVDPSPTTSQLHRTML
jgi:DNA-binding SARP family transcriptional activator